MTFGERSIDFVRRTFDTFLYFLLMVWKENFRNYISRAGHPRTPAPVMAILGNGPSLNRELPRLLEHETAAERDFMAVNYFALDERFEILQPAYYVLSDPMFFRKTAHQERVDELYRVLNDKVTWPMNLYVQFYNPEKFDYRAALPNPNIRIVPFHSLMFRGYRSWEKWLFRHGLGSANFGTVVQVGEYVALLLGYKNIELYGVDHTLLEGLTVDDENCLCRADRHYYDTAEDPRLTPVMRKVPPTPYTLAEYLAEVAELFRGHEVLRDYAASLGARIVNGTERSMIDAYERMKN